MHITMHDDETYTCEYPAMETPCPACGYKLHSRILTVGAFRLVVYSDGEREVECCPRCGARLDGNAVRLRDLARRGQR